MGIPYEKDKLKSTVLAMTVDPIAYSLLTLDKQRGKIKGNKSEGLAFTGRYLTPARTLVPRFVKLPAFL